MELIKSLPFKSSQYLKNVKEYVDDVQIEYDSSQNIVFFAESLSSASQYQLSVNHQVNSKQNNTEAAINKPHCRSHQEWEKTKKQETWANYIEKTT